MKKKERKNSKENNSSRKIFFPAFSARRFIFHLLAALHSLITEEQLDRFLFLRLNLPSLVTFFLPSAYASEEKR